ncbi:MAG TPA: hypothetical protein VGN87_05650, partial [Paenibacillus sp.]
ELSFGHTFSSSGGTGSFLAVIAVSICSNTALIMSERVLVAPLLLPFIQSSADSTRMCLK